MSFLEIHAPKLIKLVKVRPITCFEEGPKKLRNFPNIFLDDVFLQKVQIDKLKSFLFLFIVDCLEEV